MGQREPQLTDFKQQLTAHLRSARLQPTDFIFIISIVATVQVEVLCIISTRKKLLLREVT